jgi:branched-chain amino acid aminotransferase
MVYIYNEEVFDQKSLAIDLENRGLNYGDGVFETLKYARGRINFWEDHYFRLMEGMRILRMEIPMTFSPEYLQEQLKKCLAANQLQDKSARLKLLVTRKAGGYYTPQTQEVDFLITAKPLGHEAYSLNKTGLKIDLFKDYYKSASLLSSIKSTSAQLYTVASTFRQENNLDECLLLNHQKEVCEAISANLFLVSGNDLITPPLSTGCLKGIIRKKILAFAPKMGFNVREEAFSPFQLQKADEAFLTNTIKGIQWIKQYRKKQFALNQTHKIVQRLNTEVALNSN